jgi:hypothetical protein
VVFACKTSQSSDIRSISVKPSALIGTAYDAYAADSAGHGHTRCFYDEEAGADSTLCRVS